MKKIAIFGAVLALSLAMFGCGGSSTSGAEAGAESAGGADMAATEEVAPAEDEAPDYSVTDENLVDQGYGVYTITGTLTNNTSDTVSYVQVEYVLKDAEGAQIGTGLANTNNLAGGGVWKYEAFCSVSGDAAPASYELVQITGF